MTFAGFGGRFVASREGKVSFGKDGPGTAELDLHTDWLKGGHVVTVTGVLTDETGRDNRSSATIRLDPKPTRGVKVVAPRDLVAAGESVAITVEPFGLGEKDAQRLTEVTMSVENEPMRKANCRDVTAADAERFARDLLTAV